MSDFDLAWDKRNNPKAWHGHTDIATALWNTTLLYLPESEIKGFTPTEDEPTYIKDKVTLVTPVKASGHQGFGYADKWTKNHSKLVVIPCLYDSHFTILIRYKGRDIFLNSFGASESQALTESSRKVGNYNTKAYQEDGWHCGDWVVMFHEVALEAMQSGELETISADELAKRANEKVKFYGGMENVRKIVTVRALLEREWDRIGEENIKSYLGDLCKYFPRLNTTNTNTNTNTVVPLETMVSVRREPAPITQNTIKSILKKPTQQATETHVKREQRHATTPNKTIYKEILPSLIKNIASINNSSNVDFKKLAQFYSDACNDLLTVLKKKAKNHDIRIRLKQILKIIKAGKLNNSSSTEIAIYFLEIIKRYKNRYSYQGFELKQLNSHYKKLHQQTEKLLKHCPIETIFVSGMFYNDVPTIVNTLVHAKNLTQISIIERNANNTAEHKTSVKENTATQSIESANSIKTKIDLLKISLVRLNENLTHLKTIQKQKPYSFLPNFFRPKDQININIDSLNLVIKKIDTALKKPETMEEKDFTKMHALTKDICCSIEARYKQTRENLDAEASRNEAASTFRM